MMMMMMMIYRQRQNGSGQVSSTDVAGDDGILKLPYIPSLTDKLFRVLLSANVRAVKYYPKTGRSLFSKLKDRTPTLSTPNCVYGVSCLDCSAQYIGQTKQTLRNRMRGHKSDCNLAKKNKNKKQNIALISHSISLNHQFDYDHPVVLDRESSLSKRLLKEMIFIQKTPNSINSRTDTRDLSAIYNNIIDKIKIPPDRHATVL